MTRHVFGSSIFTRRDGAPKAGQYRGIKSTILARRYSGGGGGPTPSEGKALLAILLGQSLNAGRGGTTAQGSTASGVSMFTGGAHVSAWNFWSTNETHAGHWSELASTDTYAEGGEGQSPGAGIGNTVLGSHFEAALICSIAIGGRPVSVLNNGYPMSNLCAALERGIALLNAAGYDNNDIEIVFPVAHGEGDAGLGTSEADYEADMTGYLQTAQLFAAQFLGDPSYVAQVFWQYPLQGNEGDNDRAINAAIRDMVNDNASFHMIGPVYQYPAETDLVHPTDEGYVLKGEVVGSAILDYFANATSPSPLEVTSVTWDESTEFVITFNQDIVRDASIDPGSALGGEDGVEWIDNGTPVAISNLSYGANTITGTLDSTPSGSVAQQVCRIALQGNTPTAAVPDNLTGSAIRVSGDGVASVYDGGSYTHHVWASPVVISNVTSSA